MYIVCTFVIICPMRCRREVAACTLQQLEAARLAQLALASICTWSDLFTNFHFTSFYIIWHGFSMSVIITVSLFQTFGWCRLHLPTLTRWANFNMFKALGQNLPLESCCCTMHFLDLFGTSWTSGRARKFAPRKRRASGSSAMPCCWGSGGSLSIFAFGAQHAEFDTSRTLFIIQKHKI